MAYFRCKTLQVRLMDMIGEPEGNVHIVCLVSHVALDVVDNALTLLGIQLPSLGKEHGIEFGIIDMAAVVWLARIEDTVQIIIHLQEGGYRSHGKFLELPQEGGRDIVAVLLGLELDLDAHLAQLIHRQLKPRRPWGRIAWMMIQRGSEALGMASLGQQAFGLFAVESSQILRFGRFERFRSQPPL